MPRAWVQPRAAVTWECGVVDSATPAMGPRFICDLEGAVHAEGGGAQWLMWSRSGGGGCGGN